MIQPQHTAAVRVRMSRPLVRRIFMAAAALAFSFGLLSGIGPHWQPEIMAASASATKLTSVVNEASASDPTRQAQPAAVPKAALLELDPAKAATESLVVTVAPKETLWAICGRYLGGCDAIRLEQIRTLNPGMDDPNHVQAGQHIRLPRDGKSSQPTTQPSVPADRN